MQHYAVFRHISVKFLLTNSDLFPKETRAKFEETQYLNISVSPYKLE